MFLGPVLQRADYDPSVSIAATALAFQVLFTSPLVFPAFRYLDAILDPVNIVAVIVFVFVVYLDLAGKFVLHTESFPTKRAAVLVNSTNVYSWLVLLFSALKEIAVHVLASCVECKRVFQSSGARRKYGRPRKNTAKKWKLKRV